MNLATDIFTTKARNADIIIAFDQSSDVQSESSVKRLHDFALERKMTVKLSQEFNQDDEEPKSSNIVHGRSKRKHVQVFEGRYQYRQGASLKDSADENVFPDVYILYCPLMPGTAFPNFNPTVSLTILLLWNF